MTDRTGHMDAETLDRHRTGELEGAERERVTAHLAECPACAAALAELSAFSAALARGYAADRAANAGEEPDWGRQRAAILARTSARPAGRRRWLTSWIPQAAAAVVAIVALGVLWRAEIREPADADRALEATRTSAPPPAARPALPEDRLEALRDQAQDVRADGARAGADLDAGQEEVREERDAGERQAQDAAAPPAEAFREAAVSADEKEQPDAPAAADLGVANQAEARAGAEEPAAAKAVPDAPAPADAVDRYERSARRALAERDTAAARRALVVWRDSLEAGAEVDPARRERARALADSLARLLASRP